MLESLFNKVTCFQACNFIKKNLQYRCFPVNITKFLRTVFFIENLRWLLLNLFDCDESCDESEPIGGFLMDDRIFASISLESTHLLLVQSLYWTRFMGQRNTK